MRGAARRKDSSVVASGSVAPSRGRGGRGSWGLLGLLGALRVLFPTWCRLRAGFGL